MNHIIAHIGATRCRRCHRILKSDPFKSEGIGRICKRKEEAEISGKQRRNDGDNDIIVPYDGGDIWIERVASPTLTPSGGTEMAIHSASGIMTNVQRTRYWHSPSGFNFGYGGSGPADFALNVLLMFCKNPDDATRCHQQFKGLFVGQETTPNRLVITRQEILDFLRHAEAEIK